MTVKFLLNMYAKYQKQALAPGPPVAPGTFQHGIYPYILTIIDKTCSKITLILTLPFEKGSQLRSKVDKKK